MTCFACGSTGTYDRETPRMGTHIHCSNCTAWVGRRQASGVTRFVKRDDKIVEVWGSTPPLPGLIADRGEQQALGLAPGELEQIRARLGRKP